MNWIRTRWSKLPVGWRATAGLTGFAVLVLPGGLLLLAGILVYRKICGGSSKLTRQ